MQPTIHWQDAWDTVVPRISADGLLVWNFDPALPVEVRFYAYDPRRDYRLCRHDYFEIFYLYSGAAMFQLGDQTYPMQRGDLVVLNSTHFHSITPPPDAAHQPIHGVLLYFLPEAVRASSVTGEDSAYLYPFFRQDAGFPHVITGSTGLPARVLELVQMIASELPACHSRARLTVKTYLKMILIQLVNHFAAYDGGEDSFHRKHLLIERLKPLFDYIDEHYSEAVTLEEAARLVGMSTSHFIHLMKRVTGLSFIAYLNQFRVSKAQYLLATTNKSIAEVSQEVGFCDQSYFGGVFRKLLQMTPSEYRRRLTIEKEETAANIISRKKAIGSY